MSWSRGLSCTLLAALAAGCPFPPGGGGGGDPVDQQARDIQQYVDIQEALDEARTEVLGESAGELVVAGNRLYWLNTASWAPTVHSHDYDTGAEVHYGFGIGEGDRWNFRVSTQAIATAEEAGQETIYHVYDADEPNREITTVTFQAPQDEQRWWAYAVSGTDLYVVTTSDGYDLWRASAGGEAVHVADLEEACRCSLGEFWEFGVEGGTMIFVESGRIWQMDLPTNTATWLENETEVGGWVSLEWDGVLFSTAVGGPWFFEYATGITYELAPLIDAADYQLNETFASVHHFQQDPTRWRDYIVYVATSGLFAYDMTQGTVHPILLDPRCDPDNGVPRVDYRRPRILENGTLFVTGLESMSCAVGAEGPIYSVDLTRALP